MSAPEVTSHLVCPVPGVENHTALFIGLLFLETTFGRPLSSFFKVAPYPRSFRLHSCSGDVMGERVRTDGVSGRSVQEPVSGHVQRIELPCGRTWTDTLSVR